MFPPPPDGFQLLHAVYAVELFLSNLSKRRCHFDIIFFSDLKHLCAPEDCSTSNAYKYQLARSVLIRHLSNQVSDSSDNFRPEVLEFESPEDSDFTEYLRTHAIQFFFCNEGEDSNHDDTVILRHLIYQLISWGKNVALINSVEWKSSKVFAPLIGRTNNVLEDLELKVTPSNTFKASEAAQVSFDDFDEGVDIASLPDAEKSLRANLSVAICQAIRESTVEEDQEEVDERIRAFLLHTAMLQTCSLSERQCGKPKAPETDKEKEDRGFLREFSEIAHLLIEDEHSLLSDEDEEELSGDIYDLVDGRIFFFFIDRLRKGEAFPENVVEVAKPLIKAVLGDASNEINTSPAPQNTKAAEPAPAPSALAFSHPALEDILKGIKLDQAPEKRDSTADVVFEDLKNWHNSGKTLTKEKRPEKASPYVLKRNQRMERDMVAYSASLTNSRGKTIDPETIIVQPKKVQAKQSKAKPVQNQGPNDSKGGGKKKGKKGGPPQKGGRQAALDAAKAVQECKAQARSNTVINHWADMCAAFEKDSNLVSRYLKADKFAYERSSRDDAAVLGSEIELYMCSILGKIWQELRSRATKDDPQGKLKFSTNTKTERLIILQASTSWPWCGTACSSAPSGLPRRQLSPPSRNSSRTCKCLRSLSSPEHSLRTYASPLITRRSVLSRSLSPITALCSLSMEVRTWTVASTLNRTSVCVSNPMPGSAGYWTPSTRIGLCLLLPRHLPERHSSPSTL